ncbi:hypothetical protein [Oerskovia flava]|uniref:hypothetical protein n=1 Tax=Oerskovia flava TaxID=2986422 RepID=UPI003CCD0838
MRPLRVAVTLVTVTAVVTAGIVVALNRLDSAPPVAERCAAELDGQSWFLSPVQADNAALIAITPLRRGFPARAGTIGIATALQESKMVNIDYGDRDSVGLFQQRPSQGWGTVEEIMDPVYSTNLFYDVLDTIDGYEDMEVTVAAQAVQRSGFPDAYAQHETRSRAWASALSGHSAAALTCELAPVATQDAADGTSGEPPSGEQEAGDPLEPFQTRLERDLLDLPAEPDGVGQLVVDARALGPGEDDERYAWAFAQWAVAAADATDVVRVEVAGQVWTREDAAWTEGAEPAPGTGHVRVTVAVAESGEDEPA